MDTLPVLRPQLLPSLQSRAFMGAVELQKTPPNLANLETITFGVSGNLWALEAHLHSCSFHSKSQNSENQSWWERRCPAIQTGDLPPPLQHLRFGPRDLTTFHWGRLTMVTVVVPDLGDCALGPSGSQRLRRVPRFGGLGRHADGARAPRHGRRRRHNDV